MTRPLASPLWATDPIFFSGVEAGLTTRLDPGAGVRGQGVLPESRLAARWENFELGTHGDWIQYLADLQKHNALRFTRTDLGVGTSTLTKLSAVQQTGGPGAPANRQSLILASGTTSGAFPSFEFMNDGTSPANIVNYGSGALPTSAPASDPGGVLFWGDTAGLVKSSSNGAVSSAAVTVTGLSVVANWVGFTASHYLAFEASTSKIYKATALGGAWANSTLTATAVYDLLTNGSGTWVLVTSNTTTIRTHYSTDDGVTWTPASALSVASTAGGCYSAQDGLFYVFTSIGTLWSSPDGITWTLAKTVAAMASGLVLGQHTVASCGAALAVVTNRAVNSIGRYPYGIAYTFDGGANWNEEYISNPLGANPISNLISANGRFYAIDGVSLYQSPLFEPPASLFTGV